MAHNLVVTTLSVRVVSSVAKVVMSLAELSISQPKISVLQDQSPYVLIHSVQFSVNIPGNQSDQHCGKRVMSLAIRVVSTVVKVMSLAIRVVNTVAKVMSLAIRVVSTVARYVSFTNKYSSEDLCQYK